MGTDFLLSYARPGASAPGSGGWGAVVPPQAHLVPSLPLVPWSFCLSGVYPEEVGPPRVVPDSGYKLSSTQLTPAVLQDFSLAVLLLLFLSQSCYF